MPDRKRRRLGSTSLPQFIDPSRQIESNNDEALIDAVINQNQELVKNLLSRGYDGDKIDAIEVIDEADENDIIEGSVLDIAISNNDFETASILVNFGARKISEQLRTEPCFAELIKKIDHCILKLENVTSDEEKPSTSITGPVKRPRN